MNLDLVRPGDVMAIRGSSLLSNLICDITGPISHVGMVLDVARPVPDAITVIQALAEIESLTLAESIADARYAYILHALDLSDDERARICASARAKLGVSYDYLDLLWQANDKLFRTDWFTEHLHSPRQEICSEFVAQDYAAIGRTFGVPADDATPVDIFEFALAQPARFSIIPLRGCE